MAVPDDRPLRLAVVESAPRGGLLIYASQLADALGARGHAVDLITARGSELRGLEHGRLREILAAAVKDPSEPPAGWRYHRRRAGIALRLSAASLRTALELRRGRYDAAILADDLNVALAVVWALLLTAGPGRPRMAAVCHEPKPRNRFAGQDVYLESGRLHTLLGRLYSRLDVVFVHGRRSLRQFEETWPPSRVRIIPFGADRMEGDERVAPPSDEARILFFGDWRRPKGLPELMAAFDLVAARVPEAQLTIAGTPSPDSDPAAVRAWAAGHDGRVELHDGYVPTGAVAGLFARARVVAVPYVAASQSSVAALGMKAARAVVATDVGDLPDSVLDGVTGRIVPPGDVEALAAALEELLTDPDLAARFGAAGRERVLTGLGWDRVAAAVEGHLRDLDR